TQGYVPAHNGRSPPVDPEVGVGEVQAFIPASQGPAESSRHRLIRRVLCVRGTVPFRARVAPRFDYGTRSHTLRKDGEVTVFESERLSLGLNATVPLTWDGVDVTARFELTEGETAVPALDHLGEGVAPRGCAHTEAEDRFEATVRYWRRWLAASRYRGRWREMVHRSALTL